jgi:hypothetical protein
MFLSWGRLDQQGGKKSSNTLLWICKMVAFLSNRLVAISVQLAWARQDAKEREVSDDIRRLPKPRLSMANRQRASW